MKKRSSTVQAGSASTLGNSATELLIVEIVVMKTSAGTSHRNIKHCVNPSQGHHELSRPISHFRPRSPPKTSEICINRTVAPSHLNTNGNIA